QPSLRQTDQRLAGRDLTALPEPVDQPQTITKVPGKLAPIRRLDGSTLLLEPGKIGVSEFNAADTHAGRLPDGGVRVQPLAYGYWAGLCPRLCLCLCLCLRYCPRSRWSSCASARMPALPSACGGAHRCAWVPTSAFAMMGARPLARSRSEWRACVTQPFPASRSSRSSAP